MKKLFLALLLMVCAFSLTQAQTFSVSPSLSIHTITFKEDTIKATDSATVFYVPFNQTIIGIQTVADYADTGTTAPYVALYKLTGGVSNGTANVKYKVKAAKTVAYATPTTAKLEKGTYYILKYELNGGSLRDVSTILYLAK